MEGLVEMKPKCGECSGRGSNVCDGTTRGATKHEALEEG